MSERGGRVAVAERLTAMFRAVPPTLVVQVVADAARELRGQVPADSLAELLHQLACHRLTELAASMHAVSAGRTGADERRS